MSMNIDAVMKSLSKHRPLFHSEADFQHSLAWEIHKMFPNTEIRLEYKAFPEKSQNRTYHDIVVMSNSKKIFIELKYLTKKFKDGIVISNGEMFTLLNHAAQDLIRYDFFKDIERLEISHKELKNITGCYAILLTNDHTYWNPPKKIESIDRDFKIHEGRQFNGENGRVILKWKGNFSKNSVKKREAPIKISDRYQMKWADYSSLGETGGKFRFLLIKI